VKLKLIFVCLTIALVQITPHCLEIDDQLKLRALYDRQIGGLFTLENATGVKSNLSIILYQARSVADESARHYELTIRVHSRNRMACRECNELLDPIVRPLTGVRVEARSFPFCSRQSNEMQATTCALERGCARQPFRLSPRIASA
jgi:hypothetical protein